MAAAGGPAVLPGRGRTAPPAARPPPAPAPPPSDPAAAAQRAAAAGAGGGGSLPSVRPSVRPGSFACPPARWETARSRPQRWRGRQARGPSSPQDEEAEAQRTVIHPPARNLVVAVHLPGGRPPGAYAVR